MKKIIMVLIGCLLFGACTNEQDSQVLKQNEQRAQELYEKAVALKDAQDYSGAVLKYEELLRNYSRSSISSKAKAEITLCQEEIRKQKEEIQRKKDEERLALFSGYQNIKFGMSKEQVKELFDGRLTQNKKEYLEYVKNKAKITFWFFNNTLYEVEVEPNAKKTSPSSGISENEDIQNTIGVLVSKYGKYEEVPNMVLDFGFGPYPLRYYKWGFKDKEVIARYLDDSSEVGMMLKYGSLTIKYRDLGIKRKKEQEEAQAAAKKEQERQAKARQQKQKELEGLI